jgi:IclR family transcriptional regulator, KDG regulon repressor
MPYTIASLDAALTLLETIAEHPGLGLTDLARRTKSTKSQVFRQLHTLETRGYVLRDPTTKTYALGYRPLFVGEKARQQTDIIRISRPFLDELGERSRENVHLIARDGTASVCIGLCESPHPLRLYAQVGRKGPLHAGGGSKVLLAFAPPDVQHEVLAGPLERYTDATITDPQTLRRLLDRIVADGYHLASQDIDEGAFAMSAPIRDHTDSVVAALSIAGPISRLNDEIAEKHRVMVLEYAGRISRALR